MSDVYVLVSDAPSEERCRVVTPLAVYTSHSKAKSERARLNKVRAEEVAKRAARLIGRHYHKLSRSGASMTYATHDEESALRYAGYEVPVIRIVPVTCNEEIDHTDIFSTERW